MSEKEQQLVKSRGGLKKTLTCMTKFISNLDSKSVTGNSILLMELSEREKKLEENLKQFDEIQEELESINEETHAAEREIFMNRYFSVKAQIQLLKTYKPATNLTSSIKLPVINPEPFTGQYSKWYAFKDVFKTIIINSDLSDVQKLLYLKSYLRDEPLNLVSTLQNTNENFNIAWETLENRYGNKTFIVNSHLKILFELPAAKTNEQLRVLSVKFQQNITALKNLDVPASQWDTILIYLFSTKLDTTTLKYWNLESKPNVLPTIDELFKFIDQRVNATDLFMQHGDKSEVSKSKPAPTKHNYFSNKKNTLVATTSPKKGNNYYAFNKRCEKCASNHYLFACEEFKRLNVDHRIAFAKQHRLCLNCLKSSNHDSAQCRHSSCNQCGSRHHSSLHLDKTEHSEPHKYVPTPGSAPDLNSVITALNSSATGSYVLLSTAIVLIFNSVERKWIQARALLDSASQTHIITKELQNKLKLKSIPRLNCISGVQQTVSKTDISTKLQVNSISGKATYDIEAIVVDSITSPTPHTNCENIKNLIPKNIQLADPRFNIPQKIDLLLGADVFYDCLSGNIIKLGALLNMCETGFGWVISGRVPKRSNQSTQVFLNVEQKPSLEQLVSRFWSIDDIAKLTRDYSQEEKTCEKHFLQTTIREPMSGKYIVSLPIKNNLLELGESFSHAFKRQLNLERKLDRNKALKISYDKFLQEYLDLGHMERVKDFDINNPHPAANINYVPQLLVIRETSASTPLRVVFDASAKSKNHKSLNDNLLVGPVTQRSLFEILVNFRIHDYVFCCDISKMYRNIWINKHDTDLLRILWRNNNIMECYRLLTVTYGTATAPYQATRCLKLIAEECEHSFPFASRIISDDTYVDDILTGSDSLEQLLESITDLKRILSSAGFELHKWVANNPKLIQKVSNIGNTTVQIDKENLSKTLGLYWDSSQDVFLYKIKLPQQQETTKRQVLSTISTIFDPLHLLGPVIITAKIFIQKMWLSGLSWDEVLSDELLTEWQQFKENLNNLKTIKVHRNLKSIKHINNYELHIFCDASSAAYGACAYLRTTNNSGEVSVKLIVAKSRVAPLKCVSLPRLELMGATIAATLKNKMCTIFPKINKTFLWCDSTIVLAWIKSPPSKWKVFVANRVSEIQELTSISDWRHVPSENNASDCLSRGVNPSELPVLSIWWNGPEFLYRPKNQWPPNISAIPSVDQTNLPELKKIVLVNFNKNCEQLQVLNKFSSFNKLIRVIAWCLRFKNNLQVTPNNRLKGELNNNEINSSLNLIIKNIQHTAFYEEIIALQQNTAISKKSKIKNLVPFLDNEGILRVTGRLQNSELTYNSQHQIILPKCFVTEIFIRSEHLRLNHSGVQAMITVIREKYWIVNAKAFVKNCIRTCITCFRFRAAASQQLMGNLPPVRVVATYKCFDNVGIDYGGPLYIKASSLKRAPILKAYICIYVCLNTRAIHLETVSDLTANAFLASFRRFVSRRGIPTQVYSDNASNFKAASNELFDLYQLLNSENFKNCITRHSTQLNIKWNFIPPLSPHFGGIWEAGIKSTKFHIKRVVGEAHLTFEEMSTFLCQVEACLNSRPLTPISPDPVDLEILTPSHFIIGRNISALPDQQVNLLPSNRLKRWEFIQKLTQSFWERWHREFLHTLQTRNKLTTVYDNIEVGAMVLIKEDNLKPTQWAIGRVITVNYGTDKLVRVATVRTANGEFKRPITKLCVLPMDKNEPE